MSGRRLRRFLVAETVGIYSEGIEASQLHRFDQNIGAVPQTFDNGVIANVSSPYSFYRDVRCDGAINFRKIVF
jgi:hypothetical protein